MITFLVVPLLWVCPGAQVPIVGRAAAALVATPARALLCAPQSGTPERYDSFQAAQDRAAAVGPGASLSLCQPDGRCEAIKITWRAIPSFGPSHRRSK